MEIEAPDSIDTGVAFNVIENNDPHGCTFHQRMTSYTLSTISEIAYRLQTTTASELEEMETFNQIVREFTESCTSLLQSVDIPDSSEALLNHQHQLHMETEYLGKKLKHLQDIRTNYAKEKQAWEDNLALFKNPLSLTSIESVDCVFEGINDTATLSRIYDDSGVLLSLLRNVKDVREEVVDVRKQLVDAYQTDVLDRWNVKGVPFSSVHKDFESARQSTV